MPTTRKTRSKQTPQKKQAQKKQAQKKQPQYTRTHRLSGRKLQFLLKEEEQALREKAASASSGRAGKTLVKEGKLRATLVALRKGTVLKQHQVEGPVSIQCMRGNVAVSANDDSTELTAGGLLVLDKKVPHDAKALRDSTILVTVAYTGGR